jgi:hypothetical protein
MLTISHCCQVVLAAGALPLEPDGTAHSQNPTAHNTERVRAKVDADCCWGMSHLAGQDTQCALFFAVRGSKRLGKALDKGRGLSAEATAWARANQSPRRRRPTRR